MPSYRTLGEIPAKRHIRMPVDSAKSFAGEGIAYEHVVTTNGFARAYSILYHRFPPTRVSASEYSHSVSLDSVEHLPLQHHHIRSQDLLRQGDPVSGRQPMMFNQDLVCWRVDPQEQQACLYRNAAADEVIFVLEGQGELDSVYGTQPYRQGDYIVIPRSTTYRIRSSQIEKERHLVLECFSAVRVPQRYQNADGQILLGSPYYERDFHSPVKLFDCDSEYSIHQDVEILIKDGTRFSRITMPHHPFDVIGWDGFVYPYTFNAADFEPLTGTVHLPPPFQQTFECRGFVICTFAPRHLDHHPEAVKVPYAHSNVEADEVLFYADGNFGSRKGVSAGSLTLHPGGIPHGPHPGRIRASENATFTNELAVMFDTEKKLMLTPQAIQLDDPQYPLSWLE